MQIHINCLTNLSNYTLSDLSEESENICPFAKHTYRACIHWSYFRSPSTVLFYLHQYLAPFPIIPPLPSKFRRNFISVKYDVDLMLIWCQLWRVDWKFAIHTQHFKIQKQFSETIYTKKKKESFLYKCCYDYEFDCFLAFIERIYLFHRNHV